ncbi:LOW QUALITY PROTEIN: hypothetical protein PoB_004265500 [Plakobranchus ocellatus]|uniref:Uncharacterized protein n=1 Tax=Plakobranchus ocellatus TaxID=259542 RepID=A0AAV4B6D8_9GAST|nr:LOW QUALITY PROTEIN: hypothetical protein PoB_004265500 [Plakobranchus ocellatus]
MAEETVARAIQIRSGETFIHRFHGDTNSDPREVDAFEEEIRQAWAIATPVKSMPLKRRFVMPGQSSHQRVALVKRYLGPGVKDELACYPSHVASDPESLLRTLRVREAYGESRSIFYH